MQAATITGFTPFAALQAEVLRDPIPLRAAVTAAYRKTKSAPCNGCSTS
jgi:RHH-type proline utilization regulon transcriptional repressor/proline dehydrogenase/delta 1-pyrroline-5-carboxylate dehydrogenase